MNKKEQFLDNANIRDLLEVYSRGSTFRLENELNIDTDPTVGSRYIGIVENNFCHDRMSVYLSIDEDAVTLQHYGHYCALAHASAELFCSLVYRIDIKLLSLLLQELREYFSSTITLTKKSIIHTNFSDIEILMKIPMSPTRKRCVMLPWEATMKALNDKR